MGLGDIAAEIERPPLQIGQYLWFAPDYQGERGYTVQVVGLGRKWAYLSNCAKVDRKTWEYIDPRDYTPGRRRRIRSARCYSSQQEEEEFYRTADEWRWLRCMMQECHDPRPGVTLEQVRAAAVLLGLPPTLSIRDLRQQNTQR